MVVGVPGTGIGGLYYILLALLMPVFELYHTIRGRGSWARWRVAGNSAACAIGILGAMAGCAWLVRGAFRWTVYLVSGWPVLAEALRRALEQALDTGAWSWVMLASGFTLLTVILVPALAAWVISRRERRVRKAFGPVPRSRPSRHRWKRGDGDAEV